MIVLKTPGDISALARAGWVAADALRQACALLRPDLRTSDLEDIVTACFAAHGATPLLPGAGGPPPFPATVSVSINDEAAHGVPGPRRLRAGDLVSIDTACRLDGWCADAAWTWAVGETAPDNRRLLEVGQAALEVAVAGCRRYGCWSEVAAAVEAFVVREGCALVEGLAGHGIGRELYEDPQVPSAPTANLRGSDFRLEPGLVLAIEPTVTNGCGRLRPARDGGWGLVTADGRPAVHFEHTVAITTGGPVILTTDAGDPAR
ncbi:MAG TPA: type I methionyl aminopeptidase [Planctomycetaceae bacterium]|nr:type I methionyl aminopeptidase [Planctomycetaceae bacterium]